MSCSNWGVGSSATLNKMGVRISERRFGHTGKYRSLTNRVRGPYRKLRTEFFPLRVYGPSATRAAINRRGKNEDP